MIMKKIYILLIVLSIVSIGLFVSYKYFFYQEPYTSNSCHVFCFNKFRSVCIGNSVYSGEYPDCNCSCEPYENVTSLKLEAKKIIISKNDEIILEAIAHAGPFYSGEDSYRTEDSITICYTNSNSDKISPFYSNLYYSCDELFQTNIGDISFKNKIFEKFLRSLDAYKSRASEEEIKKYDEKIAYIQSLKTDKLILEEHTDYELNITKVEFPPKPCSVQEKIYYLDENDFIIGIKDFAMSCN